MKRIIKILEEEYIRQIKEAQRNGRERLIQQIEALSEPKDGDRLVITGTKWHFLKGI